MGDFFKLVGKGALYLVLSPFIVLLLALYFIYCLIMFLVMGIVNLVVFFSGGTINGDLPEDIEAKRILEEKFKQENNVAPVTQTQNNSNVTYNNPTIIVADQTMMNHVMNNLNNNSVPINSNIVEEEKPVEIDSNDDVNQIEEDIEIKEDDNQ